ncbi:hypothetical protein [uncultured Sphingomonas sp.]|uniref:hypothetical protein n=1 Tax=uncultured Sphingomonas sp. TaxID=158754 RepID=UPI0026098BEE|nr:hypothetical protein [uncultured Sphingomonas sp.]
MRKTILLAAATAATFATAAVAADEQRFTHDGQTYVYTATPAKSGQVIEGRRYPGGEPFRLVVRDGRVSGFSGKTPGSFRAADAKGAVSRGLETSAR